MHEMRRFPRYSARGDVDVTLLDSTNNSRTGHAVDISLGGAYLRDVSADPGMGTITIKAKSPSGNGRFLVERNCQILQGRQADNGGCAIRFNRPLSGDDLAQLVTNRSATGSIDLARQDYRIVSDEIHAIQLCRSHIFLAAIGAISAWLMGVAGLFVTGNLTHFGLWSMFGASLPFALLTIAIMTSIEKARAINFRRGFLSALTEYIRHDTAPPDYPGWAHLYLNRSECVARQKSGQCDHPGGCWKDAFSRHTMLTKDKPAVAGIYSSFASQSTMIYAFLYAVTVSILVMACVQFLKSLGYSEWVTVFITLTIGALLTIVAFYLLGQLHMLRKGKYSVEAEHLIWQAVLRYCRPLGSQLDGG